MIGLFFFREYAERSTLNAERLRLTRNAECLAQVRFTRYANLR